MFIFYYALKAIEADKVCLLVTLDLKKAFNSVARNILLTKFETAGIDPHWYAEYFSIRTQRVKDPFEHFSDLCYDLWGIPQGGVLSAILFSIFINEIPSIPIWCLAILFADDLSLLITCYPHEISDTICKLEYDIDGIISWLNINKLELNGEKTELIVIGSSVNVKYIDKICISVNNCTIYSKESVTILGFIIDNTLSCSEHVQN